MTASASALAAAIVPTVERRQLTRLVIIALAYLAVSASLMTRPAAIIDYWYLFYCPVVISAMSFGLRGAVLGAIVAAASTTILVNRLLETLLVVRDPAVLVALLNGDTIQDALTPLISPGTAMQFMQQLVVRNLSNTMSALSQIGLGGAVITAIACVAGWQADMQRAQEQATYRQARTDGLTGLGNYRSLMEGLEEAVDHGRPFGLVLIDLDMMKAINDQYGHPSGDVALQHVATLLRAEAGKADLVTRHGGDEFGVAIMAHGEQSPSLLAYNLGAALLERAKVDPAILPDGKQLYLKFSIGAAGYPENGGSVKDVMRAVDNALYEAKRLGRNRVERAGAPTGPTPISDRLE